MAIRKEEEKKVGMKVTDNMDGEQKANGKLMAKYEPGKVFSMSKYKKYFFDILCYKNIQKAD